MRRARGFSGLEIIGIIVAAAMLVGAIAGAIHLVTSYLDGVRQAGFEAGKKACEVAYTTRDNEQLIKVQAELVAALKAKELAEEKARVLGVALGKRVQQEKAKTDETKERTLADLASGALVLRDGIVQTAACPADDSPEAAGKAAGPRPGAGGKTCYRLAAEAERAVVEAAARADRYAVQIIGLLEQRTNDMATCNAP